MAVGVIRNDLYGPRNVSSLDRVGQCRTNVVALDAKASLPHAHGPGKGPYSEFGADEADGLLGSTDPTRLVGALGGFDKQIGIEAGVAASNCPRLAEFGEAFFAILADGFQQAVARAR